MTPRATSRIEVNIDTVWPGQGTQAEEISRASEAMVCLSACFGPGESGFWASATLQISLRFFLGSVSGEAVPLAAVANPRESTGKNRNPDQLAPIGASLNNCATWFV